MDTDAVDEVIEADGRLMAAAVELYETVQRARGEGVPWWEIGQALGVTAQAAQQRFGRAKGIRDHLRSVALQTEQLFDA